jgi:hypothetical protein
MVTHHAVCARAAWLLTLQYKYYLGAKLRDDFGRHEIEYDLDPVFALKAEILLTR